VEGEYRFTQLKTFLTERDLPLCIWVSEDATRLSSKIEYDSISNKIVGFVLPFSNGEANVNAYLGTSITTIAEFFKRTTKQIMHMLLWQNLCKIHLQLSV